MKFKKITYIELNARQKESYNFQKVSAVFADYWFVTIRLSDDWQGADFIAQHIDGDIFLKVQLKWRLTLDKKYIGKNLWICFPLWEDWYLYEHDIFMQELSEYSSFQNTKAWIEWWNVSNGSPTKQDKKLLEKYKL